MDKQTAPAKPPGARRKVNSMIESTPKSDHAGLEEKFVNFKIGLGENGNDRNSDTSMPPRQQTEPQKLSRKR